MDWHAFPHLVSKPSYADARTQKPSVPTSPSNGDFTHKGLHPKQPSWLVSQPAKSTIAASNEQWMALSRGGSLKGRVKKAPYNGCIILVHPYIAYNGAFLSIQECYSFL